ncbi:MAG: hypothetical protein ABSH34_26315 [Verrucomicrobiota bacterium]|jgi:hypothetical protein
MKTLLLWSVALLVAGVGSAQTTPSHPPQPGLARQRLRLAQPRPPRPKPIQRKRFRPAQ